MGFLCSICSCSNSEKNPYIRYEKEITNDFTSEKYDQEYQRAVEKREEFWAEQIKELSWEKEPTVILEKGEGNNFDKWFTDGEMNIVFNCLDRHVDADRGDDKMFLYVSPQSKITAQLDYDQVCANTGKVANVFKNQFGVEKGDQVFFYAPTIPMILCLMLSCARMGAVHNGCYGGECAKTLAERLDESNPKLIIVVSGAFEPVEDGKRTEENPYTITKYVPILEEALALCKTANKDCKKIIYQRLEMKGVLADEEVDNEKYTDYKGVCEDDELDEDDCDMVPSTHPLYVAYTSAATGTPKGIVRDHGSTAVALNYAMKNIFNINKESVQFAACHQAWSIGLDFMLYGPLLRGCQTVIWEGDCLYPDPFVLWTIVATQKVTNLYVNISMLREIKKEDYEGEGITSAGIDSLKTICLVGERGDPDTINWLHQFLPDVIINDTYFCTELGWPIAGQLCDLEAYETVFPTLPGSVTRAVPGFEIKIMDSDGKECEQGAAGDDAAATASKIGRIAIKRPLPPGCAIDVQGTQKDAALKGYFEDIPDHFSTGDSGFIDENGYLKVVGRTEDVITLQSGEKVFTQAFEDSINEREEVAESAVVAFSSKERGEAPLAFVVLRAPPADQKDMALAKPASEKEAERKAAARQIRKNVNTDCGEDARLVGVIFVDDLPKTRSGQIMRKAIRDISTGGSSAGSDHPFNASEDVLNSLKVAFEAWSEPAAESTLSEKEDKNRGCF